METFALDRPDTPRTDAFYANPPENEEAYQFACKLEAEAMRLRREAASKYGRHMRKLWVSALLEMHAEAFGWSQDLHRLHDRQRHRNTQATA